MKQHNLHITRKLERDLCLEAFDPSRPEDELEASRWGLKLLLRIPTNPQTYHMQGVNL